MPLNRRHAEARAMLLAREAARKIRTHECDELRDSDAPAPRWKDIRVRLDVRRAIAQLSVRCAAVMTMRHYWGMTLSEISEGTGMSMSGIYGCLRDAEAALRVMLRDYRPPRKEVA